MKVTYRTIYHRDEESTTTVEWDGAMSVYPSARGNEFTLLFGKSKEDIVMNRMVTGAVTGVVEWFAEETDAEKSS